MSSIGFEEFISITHDKTGLNPPPKLTLKFSFWRNLITLYGSV